MYSKERVKMSKLLQGGSLRRVRESADINPLEGVANLADVMLVLACGLILSLIVSFNVDWGRSEKLVGLTQGEQISEIDGFAEGQEDENGGAHYEELGKVYRDPATGKLYMVIED